MVVRSALTSPKAAEAQNSTLEFILVNHPLDCPVCDKGGECPLQDLTFRYGPGSTRMFFPKRTFEKPIPISPTIALDRERCILCYRCTRFSESVSEDLQLVALNRGASSMIATFEDEPYVGAFSGNVIELCPVGALTSTQYRFEARPWEIQNVPTVCGLCPVGCNISATTREGKVKRILSRNHPEVDDGWLCDKGRFAFSHLYASDRITEPRRRVGAQAFEPVRCDAALDEAERLLRQAGTHTVTALSGTETVEQAYALAKLLRRGLGAHAALMPEVENARALDGFRRPLSSIGDADVIAVLGDEPLAESRADRRPLGPRGSTERRRGPLRARRGEAARAPSASILIGSGELDNARSRPTPSALGAWAAFHVPRAANARGVCEAWAAASDEDEAESPDPVRLLVISGDEALANPAVRALAEQAEHVLVFAMFERPGPRARRPRPARDELPRARGDVRQPRGPAPATAPRRRASGAGRARRGSPASPSASASTSRRTPPACSTSCPTLIYDGLALLGRSASARRCRRGAAGAASRSQPRAAQARSATAACASSRTGRSSPGPAVERVPELQFQRPEPVLEIAADDAHARGIRPGDEVDVSSTGPRRACARGSRARFREGRCAPPTSTCAGLPHDVEVTRA